MTEFGRESEHDKYEELCALATAGILTPAELDQLDRHLKTCAQCREAYAQYQSLATNGMASLADHFAAPALERGFDESSALARLIHAAEEQDQQAHLPAPAAVPFKKALWHREWVRGAIAASVVVSVGAASYWTGAHSANIRLRTVSTVSQFAVDRERTQKQDLEKTIQADKREIAALEQQRAVDKDQVSKLQLAAAEDAQRLASLTDALGAAQKDADMRLAALTKERDADANKLHDAERMYQTVQDELNSLRTQRQQDMVHLASLEARINNLNGELSDQNKRTQSDERYLASDKDIRDLIGARNLYIADIMDVNETGQSSKPFGRVFYTKTKSLIFYAYDLDRHPGVKRTSTFQVWGRTSADDRKPINLGILYLDSESNRRWTLRVDNPEQLAHLDAVFVTIEPREQTNRPTGKPFLYASLRREPNHP